MFPAGFEPTISESERPQTHTLGRAGTGQAPLSNALPNLRYGFSVYTTARGFIGTDVVEENVGRS
jgi:hypothetical protein